MRHPIACLKTLFCFICLLILVAFPVQSQIKTTLPSWVNVIDLNNIGQVNKNQIKKGFYYVLVDEQYQTVKKQRYFHYAVSAITEEALVNVSQIEFSYDPHYQQAYLHAVKIHRGNTIIDKTSTLDLKILNEENERNNGILNGEKTVYTNLSDIRKGDIVEYSYSILGQNPIMKDYFNLNLLLSYSVPVGKIHQRVLFSKDIKPSLLTKNTSIQPTIKITDVNDYTWEINNPPITIIESSTPDWYNPYRNVQISNLKNWQEVKEHCKSLLKMPSYNQTELKKIVDSIIGLKQPLETEMTSIIEFVQTNIRYSGNETGIYSHVPRTPDYVLKNRFGDCKEKSVLLCEMLKLIHVESYPVLVNTSLNDKVNDQNPSINAFDHCIVAYIYHQKLQFIDPTLSYQRGNFTLRNVPSYGQGMVLDNSPEAFKPIVPNFLGKSSVLEEFFIEASGDTRLKVTTTCTGTYADNMRYYFLTNSADGIQENYKQYYYKFTEDMDVVDTLSYLDNEAENTFTIHESYILHAFWTPEDSTKSKVITKDFMPYSLNDKLNYGEESKRKDPLEIAFPFNSTHTITIEKEGGWNVEKDKDVEDNPFFTYSFSKEVKDNTLYLTYDYKSKTDVIEPTDYKSYKKKMDFINNNMIFSAQQKPLAEGILNFNWVLVLTLICSFFMSIALVIYLYHKPTSSNYINEYDNIGGWLVLLGIGLVINPFTLLLSLYNEYKGEMEYNYLVYFFSEKSDSFSPLHGYFTLFIAFFNVAMLVFSVFIIIIFFQRKASFRIYFTAFRIFNVLFLIINVIILYVIYGKATEPEERRLISEAVSSMMKVLLTSGIWVPYVLFSERSKHTFTNGNFKETYAFKVPQDDHSS